MSKSKKIKSKSFTEPHTILELFRWGATDPALVWKKLGIPRQNLQHYLKKWCIDGILVKNTRGVYVMTPSGKKYCDEYEELKNKKRVQLENLRIRWRILTNVDKLWNGEEWEPSSELKNGVYHFRNTIEGHMVKLIISTNSAFIEITSLHTFDEIPAEAYFVARLEIERVFNNLMQKYDFSSGYPVITSKPQYAWSSPISESLLEVHGASEIKTPNVHYNRSNGRCADIEPTSLEHAEKILEMPYHVETLEEDLGTLIDCVIGLDEKLAKVNKYFESYAPFDFSNRDPSYIL